MSFVYVLQHAYAETLGTIEPALVAAGLKPRYIQSFAGQSVPLAMEDAAGLVVLGGPMGVADTARFRFLKNEMYLIEDALAARKPVLSICLGSQLLATVLGAEVRRGAAREIGWFPITLSDAALADPLWAGCERIFTAFSWHGDIFDLPAGAAHLASSAQTRCQGFRVGRNAYGLLFHMEVTAPIIAKMAESFRQELDEEKIDRAALVSGAERHLAALNAQGERFFRAWVALCTA